jgi:hypothetical protein
MAIEFSMKSIGYYLLVTCQGLFDAEELTDVHRKALDCAVEENLRAILVDTTDLRGHTPSTMERFNFGATIAKLQQRENSHIFIAFVGKEPVIDPSRFGETVALNRGGSAKVFEYSSEALRWIEDYLTPR